MPDMALRKLFVTPALPITSFFRRDSPRLFFTFCMSSDDSDSAKLLMSRPATFEALHTLTGVPICNGRSMANSRLSPTFSASDCITLVCTLMP